MNTTGEPVLTPTEFHLETVMRHAQGLTRLSNTQQSDLFGVVARRVVELMEDSRHPFTQMVLSLRKEIKDNKLPKPVLLAPQPATGTPMRNFWPVQFLLRLAADNPVTRGDLGRELQLAPKEIRDMLAKTQSNFNNSSIASSTGHFLCQALPLLAEPSAGPALRLDDRTVIVRGVSRGRLSIKNARLLRILLEHGADGISHQKLDELGVGYPDKTLSRLRDELGRLGVDALQIFNERKNMSLRLSQS